MFHLPSIEDYGAQIANIPGMCGSNLAKAAKAILDGSYVSIFCDNPSAIKRTAK